VEIVKRSAAEWLELFLAQERSGQSQRAWCEANGVNYATFTKRLLVMRRKGAFGGKERGAAAETAEGKSYGGKWLEIRAPEKRMTGFTDDRIQVAVGVFRIVIPDNFEEAAFKKVCRALAELC